MVWDGMLDTNNTPCQFVLGQSDALQTDHNQGNYLPTSSSLNMPYGMTAIKDWLIVTDTANSRLLAWHIDDVVTGAKARGLAGQPDFQDKGDNQWKAVSEKSMCWSYGVQACGNKIIVSDSGNSRVQIWETAL